MDLLVLRPLITALIEYFLAVKVYREGKFLNKTISLFLVFLASYQMSEFLYFTSNYDRFWLTTSLFATTMLPPFGFAIIEGLSGKKAYPIIFFIFSIAFSASFFIFPQIIPEATECNCFTKFDYQTMNNPYSRIFTYWSYYYILSLTLSMVLIVWHLFKKNGDFHNLKWLLFGYASFYPASMIVAQIVDRDLTMYASIMCSMAIFMAFITTRISLNKKTDSEEQNKLNISA